jgi:hypothetical protein
VGTRHRAEERGEILVRGILCGPCNRREGHWRRAEELGVREYLGVPDAAVSWQEASFNEQYDRLESKRLRSE